LAAIDIAPPPFTIAFATLLTRPSREHCDSAAFVGISKGDFVGTTLRQLARRFRRPLHDDAPVFP
jgi:hypothetical protein